MGPRVCRNLWHQPRKDPRVRATSRRTVKCAHNQFFIYDTPTGRRCGSMRGQGTREMDARAYLSPLTNLSSNAGHERNLAYLRSFGAWRKHGTFFTHLFRKCVLGVKG